MDCITKVGDVVAKTITDGIKTSDNKWLFDPFNKCIELIRQARVGDNESFIIAEAEKKLPNDITMKKETIGPGRNPTDPTKK